MTGANDAKIKKIQLPLFFRKDAYMIKKMSADKVSYKVFIGFSFLKL